MVKWVRGWFRERARWLNPLLALAAYGGNRLIQVFCQPVPWAGLVLVLAIGAFLLWPWLGRAPRAVQLVALFLQGLALTVCAYCTWFLGWEGYLLATVLFFLWAPMLGWVPMLFGVQLLGRARRSNRVGRLCFLAGALLLAPVYWWAARQYDAVVAAATRLSPAQQHDPAALAAVLPHSYMTERVVGMHFRYHTRPELIYDGWRPPLHDPLIPLNYWRHNYHDPLVGVDRVQLYRRLFPGRPIKPDCLCAYDKDGRQYLDWQPPAP